MGVHFRPGKSPGPWKRTRSSKHPWTTPAWLPSLPETHKCPDTWPCLSHFWEERKKRGTLSTPILSLSSCSAVCWLQPMDLQAGRKHCPAVNDHWLQAGRPPWPPARKGRTLPSKSGRNWSLWTWDLGSIDKTSGQTEGRGQSSPLYTQKLGSRLIHRDLCPLVQTGNLKMENELRKEGAWPPVYRERQQVVGTEHWGFVWWRELCCMACLKEFTGCKCQKASGQVRMPCGQLRAEENQEASLSYSLQLLPWGTCGEWHHPMELQFLHP